MAIFCFQMMTARYLGYLKFEISCSVRSIERTCINVPNVKIDQYAAEIIVTFRFVTMAVVRHLGFVWGVLGPPSKSILVANCDRCSSFDNMTVCFR